MIPPRPARPAPVYMLTPAEVAKALSVSKMTVYRLIHSGELTAVSIGRSYRIRADTFARYVEASQVAAPKPAAALEVAE